MISLPSADPVHRLAALWVADTGGSTRLSSGDETSALHAVELLQACARQVIARHQGRRVERGGDAVLAEFGSTEVATRAALALRAEFTARAAAAGVPARLRIGVHVGDVVSAPDREIHGEGVDTAARLRSQAPPGGVAVSEDVWRQLRPRPEFHFEALGARRLTGSHSLPRVFSVAPRAEADEKRAGAAAAGRLHRAPRGSGSSCASRLRRWIAVGTSAVIALMSSAALDRWL